MMDREIESLKRAKSLDPDNRELQQRLANTVRRIPHKDLEQPLEIFVLFLSGMAKVLIDCTEFTYSDPELESKRTEPGMILRLWEDSFGASVPPEFSELVRSRLRQAQDPKAPALPRPFAIRNPQKSIWEPCLEFCEIFVDLLHGIYEGNWNLSELLLETLTTPFLNAVSELVNHGFEGADYAWVYELIPAPSLGPGEDEASLLVRLQQDYAQAGDHYALFGRSPRVPETFLQYIENACQRGPFVANTPNPITSFWPSISSNSVSWGGGTCYFAEALAALLSWHSQVNVECFDTSAMSRATHFHMSLIKVGEQRYYLRTYYD